MIGDLHYNDHEEAEVCNNREGSRFTCIYMGAKSLVFKIDIYILFF